MRSRFGTVMVVALAFLFHTWAPPASARNKYRILHSFKGGADGGGVFGGVGFDTKGSLYGTTSGGGAYGEGTVFRLVSDPDSKWIKTILYSFCRQPHCADGALPLATPIFDHAGDLYGNTSRGDNNYGVTFELTPDPYSGSGWVYRVIYDSGSDGLLMDGAGNLYGEWGPGKYEAGDVFELTPGSHGWTEKVLHNFCSAKNCNDGVLPQNGLTWDPAGNLYGVTTQGGVYKAGVAFELERTGGAWKEHVLHNFRASRSDGYAPYAGLVFDSSGNLYGTTEQGGSNASGTVFQLSRQLDGRWKETILYDFPNGSSDGQGPAAGLVFDKAGDLYGTTSGGGDTCSCGVVFKLTPEASGKWKYTVLHRFTGADGWVPQASLTLDDKGNLYGTTTEGGPGGYGVVFEITP